MFSSGICTFVGTQRALIPHRACDKNVTEVSKERRCSGQLQMFGKAAASAAERDLGAAL